MMHEKVRVKFSELIVLAFKKIDISVEAGAVYKTLVEPPNLELAHLAFGCFIVSKELKKSPAAVSTELCQSITANFNLNDYGVQSVLASGPYLNFKVAPEFLFQNVVSDILDHSYFKRELIEPALAQKTMIEYSQPNTHKELHVGHMRNLCLGDALIRLMRRAYGVDKIISTTFPGDVGTHVAKCLWYIKNHVSEFEFDQKSQTEERGEWLGQMYSAGNLKLEDEAAIPEQFERNKKQLTEILKQLEMQSGEYFDLWKETRQWSVDLMNKVYHWADVTFDRWYWESEVDTASVETVKKYYSEGKLQKSEGAIGLDFSDSNLGFCLLLKSDGTGLYATKDLELARRKFEEFKIQKSIYVVDQRQALHFKQVFKTLEHLGFEQAKDCFHLQYNFVELPDGAMSSRKGNIVPLMHLVSSMQEHVKHEYLSRYEKEWSETEIDQVADTVAKGAIKYGMLKQDTNKKIVFDMSEWLKLDGESGPFIQYSYARINSLLKKFSYDHSLKINGNLLTHVAEIQMMQHLMNFNSQILLSADGYKPASMCSYLYDTAKKFNVFYHECSIGQAENEEVKEARLSLAYATGLVLKEGLSLLGIPVPERM
ncbi:MAG: arginine--tRNA ligase [Bdellovibrionaceae bacterium]|nr:arginine--tRNA ligase [Pseudobdellovibrionaceae bacterium]